MADSPGMAHPKLQVVSRTPDRPTDRPPLLFVHGLWHAAWAFDNWLDAAAQSGFPAHAVSLRAHGASEGSRRTATLNGHVSDVVRTIATLPEPPVLVGHSMGGLVTQVAAARVPVRALVLVASIPAHPAVGSLAAVTRRHPLDALRIVALQTTPLRPSYFFHRLDEAQARAYAARMVPESPIVQYQLLLHRPPGRPLGGAPVLVLGSPEDRLVPVRDLRRTAGRYDATLEEFPGMGHDLMLDEGWDKVFDVMDRWLAALD